MRTQAFAIVLVAGGMLIGCDPAATVECPKGWTMCGGTCKALGSDGANCGACGNVCGATESCAAGACAAACAKQLSMPLPDPWGSAWDGLERPSATLPVARAACEAIGGRLPTLSELHRVSAVKTGAVADTYKIDPLWALTPADGSTSMAIRLSDGVTSVRANTSATTYRCVCPAPPTKPFAGGACQGAPGTECFSFTGDATLNYDSQDRPAATEAAAIWECAFSGGQLASPERLAAAVTAGLPNGSSSWLHTADQSMAANGTLLKWANSTWTANGNISFDATTVLYPFRCAGPKSAAVASASSVVGGVVAPSTGVVADGADQTAGATVAFADAVGGCVTAGGHLPTGSELASAAMQGVPRTETGLLWAGDEVESAMAATFGWTGVATWAGGTGATVDGLGFVSPTSISGSAKTALLPYRCLYPAVDPTYAGPANADCNGDCALFEQTAGRGGSTPARTWFDKLDRTAATYEGAASFCATIGGRVASARDLIEGIRNGLPGTAGATPEKVLTADIAAVNTLTRAAYCDEICLPWIGCIPITCYPDVYTWFPAHYVIPQWSGTDNATYADSAGSAVDIGTSARFRCMWTNEIR